MADRRDDKSRKLPEKAAAPRPPAVRISDADRNRMVEVLRTYCGEGVLTLDEFSDRVALVFDAGTKGELEQVVADLPALSGAPVPEAQRRKTSRNAVGIMSGARRTGRWRPGEEFNAFALMGGCEIDLRQAEIDGGSVTINASAIMGGIDIIVPDGIEVDLDEFHFMGAVETKLSNTPIIHGSPVVRVKAFALMGSVVIRTKKTREQREASRSDTRQRALERRQEMLERRKAHVERHLEQHTRRIEEKLERVGLSMPAARPAEPPEPPEGTSWSQQLANKAAPDGTVTILFSDIVGYTELTETLGDLRAHERLTAHNEILRAQLAAHEGYEVKSQGDGFMVAFAGASRALRCAIALQRAFADYCRKRPDEPIQVHIGLNTGEVLKEGDDFLGRTVILASRIAGEAKSCEILASSVVKALADGSGEFMFDVPREVSLKGVSQPQTVYPVVWQV
jgi:class 3 adenylate cyclase